MQVLNSLEPKIKEWASRRSTLHELAYLAYMVKHTERSWWSNVYSLKMMANTNPAPPILSYQSCRVKFNTRNEQAETDDKQHTAEDEVRRVAAAAKIVAATAMAAQISKDNDERSNLESVRASEEVADKAVFPAIICQQLDAVRSCLAISVTEGTHVSYTLDGTDPSLPSHDPTSVQPGSVSYPPVISIERSK